MKKTINMLRHLLTPGDKKQLCVIIVLTGVGALWEVAGIGLMIPVVATIVNPELLQQNDFLRAFYEISPFKEHRYFMLFTAGLVVVNFALKNLFNWLVIVWQCKIIYRNQQKLSKQMFCGFINAEYDYMLEHSPAELSSKISRAGIACEGTLLPLMLIAGDILSLAALLAALLWFMPLVLSLALLVLLAVGAVCYLPFRRINSSLSEKYVGLDNKVNADKISAFSGIKAIKTTNSGSFFTQRFSDDITDYTTVARYFYQLGQLPRLGLDFLAVAFAVGIFSSMIIAGVPSGTVVLNFALLVAGMGRMLPMLTRIHYNLTRLRQVDAVLSGLFEDVTNVKSESMQPESGSITLQKALEIKNIDFAYPDGKKVFNGFSCTIPAKTSVALIGATGSGKTTLADLIIGLHRVQGGTICFDGVDCRNYFYQVRQKTGYVPQYVFLTEGSIRENVAFGLDKDLIDDSQIIRALELAHLKEWVESLPEKYNSLVGENGVKLSGGQRQRLGIARALYRNPELLILDEATSALDSASENAVVEALNTLHGKLTMLVIAHRPSTIEHCDSIIELGK